MPGPACFTSRFHRGYTSCSPGRATPARIGGTFSYPGSESSRSGTPNSHGVKTYLSPFPSPSKVLSPPAACVRGDA